MQVQQGFWTIQGSRAICFLDLELISKHIRTVAMRKAVKVSERTGDLKQHNYQFNTL